MEYSKFNSTIRDMFDNVYAIHWKESSLDHIREVIEYLRSRGNSVLFYTPHSNPSENIDFAYIERYFNGKEDDFPSLEVKFDDFKLNCFLEFEPTISFWFNDSSDSKLTEGKFSLLKKLMKDLASKFDRTIYFVNEGESTHRYKIFKVSNEAVESDYDLNDISKYAEKL